MKKNKLTLILLLAFAACPTNAVAQRNAGNVEGNVLSLTEIRNPFESKLPDQEEIARLKREKERLEREEEERIQQAEQERRAREEEKRRLLAIAQGLPVAVASVKIEEPPPPPPPPPPVAPQWSVSGIIWNSLRPQAIVNGQVVDVGDQVEEFKIVNISPSGIDVTIDDFHFRVTP